MQLSRRNFISGALAAGAAASVPALVQGARWKAGVAVQLYSIREYIGGKKDGSVKGVGLPKALADVKALGYGAVEFAGYYNFSASDLKKMLDDNGLVACGTHVHRSAFEPKTIQKTIDFNLGFGNRHLVCPGSGMWPDKKWDKGYDEWWKRMVEFYAKAADTANKSGCTLGYHNHTREFEKPVAMKDGTLMWDYFFTNTPQNVCMQQDVGWTTAAGQDPCYWFKRFPHRAPSLHAKENGCLTDGKGKRIWADHFEGILGQPGSFNDGRKVKGVDWDKLFPVTDADGVKWYVVECEKNAANLTAIDASLKFLKGKGLV